MKAEKNELRAVLVVPAEIAAGVEVRVAGTQDEPLFCLRDVCNVLGIGNSGDVAKRLDDDEFSNIDQIDVGKTGTGGRGMTYVTESGLYKVIIRSDKPNAKSFTNWVCREVLPSIRKHGCYPAPEERRTVGGSDLVREIAAAIRESLAVSIPWPVAAPVREMPDLINPREYVIRCWPGVPENVLKNIVRRTDTIHRNRLGVGCPQLGEEDNAPLMLDRKNLWILTDVIACYWRKEHPPEAAELPFEDCTSI